MQIIKCTMKNLEEVANFYNMVTEYLDKTINYPKWTKGEYPGTESTRVAIENGEQYACIEDGTVIGAFILNDNPQGDYSKGDWERELNQGEYMVIHTLATAPDIYHKGIGKAMVKYCIETAKASGYKALRLDAVPTNTPARGLYERMGFSFAGDKDLLRNIKEIPTFVLYELNF